MSCPACGTSNEAGAKFCIECGTRLAQPACPSCGTTLPPSARFCAECGTPVAPRAQAAGVAGPTAIAPPAPGAQPAVPVAERRLVSVLFADLVGFTTFSEGRDAEDVRETLTRYFDLAREVVERYGGTVEKFIGDAVMAVWGTPTAHEDDAERAVRTALDLVDVVRSLGPGIEARAGVLTGEAAVTIGATGQGMVAGDLVNTASRLQSAAPPGTVLVGEPTERAAAKAIAFEPAGDQTLKGKALPVTAFRALRVVAERGGRGRSDALEAPFVGRDDELRLLKDLFHATSRERRVRLLSITGEGGIGKSRLAWEFEKYLDGLVEPVNWHHGRSPSYGEGVTFWALGEMVRGRAGLTDTDDEERTRSAIAATLRTFVPDESERRWLEPRLLALLGIEEPGAGSRDDLFAAWRTFFERVAADATAVLIFEDLHWADPGLLDFIDHVLDWSKGFPICIVTLARPELLDRRPDWGAGRRSFLALGLEPLTDEAMHALLAGLVPGLPASAARAIVERAGGVPLYAVETVRMLVAEGRLVESAGTYRPNGDLTELAVPETLHALIAARLDALEAADRALLQDAAVLGQSFTLAGLATVTGAAPAALEPRLRALVRRELLVVEADPRSPELGQYAFVQALIREVAYSTLTKRDRRARHLAAARFFESLEGEELAGAVAGHYLAAWRSSPDDVDAAAVAERARHALLAAADRASGLGSHAQALSFLEGALSTGPTGAERAILLERAGWAAARAGSYERAEALLRDAVKAHRETGQPVDILRATRTLADALGVSRQAKAAIVLAEEARAAFAELARDPAYLRMLASLARLRMLDSDLVGSLAVCDEALPQLERAGMTEEVADVLATKGATIALVGRLHEARALLEGAIGIAQREGLPSVQTRATTGLTNLLALDDPRAVVELERDALELTKRLGDTGRVIVVLAGLVEDEFRIGEWADERRRLDEHLAGDLNPTDRGLLMGQWARLQAASGEDPSAAIAELAELAATRPDEVEVRVNILEASAWRDLAAGKAADAIAGWRSASTISALNAPYILPHAAHAALWDRDGATAGEILVAIDATSARGRAFEANRKAIRAGVLALTGHMDEAMPLYREALAELRDLGVAWDLAATGLDLAACVGPSEPLAATAIDEARSILERLGAVPFLAILDSLTANAAPVSASA